MEMACANPANKKRTLARSKSGGTRTTSSAFSSRPAQQQHYRRVRAIPSSGLFRRNADRQLAALHFLSNIPMKSELQVLNIVRPPHQENSHGRENYMAPTGKKEDRDMKPRKVASRANDSSTPVLENHFCRSRDGVDSTSIPGKQLNGLDAFVVSVPESIRHKYQHSAAVVRQWERRVKNAGILDGRLFISSRRGYPLVVASVVEYKPGSESEKRWRARQVNERGGEAFHRPVPDWRGVRYGALLHAERAACSAERDVRDGGYLVACGGKDGVGAGAAPASQSPFGASGSSYDPASLDDPALSHGRTRQLNVGGPGLGPVVFSIIHFRKPKQLKEELNKQFRERHPTLPPSLTLSKIRRLKKQAAIACYEGLGVELGTLALACVYFEKLCLLSLVTKSNRRLAFATCLILSYKFQEQGLRGSTGNGWQEERESKIMSVSGSFDSFRDPHLRQKSRSSITGGNNACNLSRLLEWIDREWCVSKKQVLEAEFGVYINLKFALHVPACEVQHHFARLCKLVGATPRDYLGEDRFRAYTEVLTGHNQHSHPRRQEDEVTGTTRRRVGGETGREKNANANDGCWNAVAEKRYTYTTKPQESISPGCQVPSQRHAASSEPPTDRAHQKEWAIQNVKCNFAKNQHKSEDLREESASLALTDFSRGEHIKKDMIGTRAEVKDGLPSRRRPSWTLRKLRR